MAADKANTAPVFAPIPVLGSAAQANYDDLLLDIYPRGYVSWEGSSAQLNNEGLIPPRFKWPERDESAEWSANGFIYELSRCRPPWMKGGKRLWVNGDHWRLRRMLASRKRKGFDDAYIYEKQQDLARAVWACSPEASEQWNRYWEAREDRGFQAFLVGAGAKKPEKAGRPRKSGDAQEEGGRHG